MRLLRWSSARGARREQADLGREAPLRRRHRHFRVSVRAGESEGFTDGLGFRGRDWAGCWVAGR